MELNGKQVDISSITVDGVNPADYPDFCDAYIDYAEFDDGTPLNDNELDALHKQEADFVYELILNRSL